MGPLDCGTGEERARISTIFSSKVKKASTLVSKLLLFVNIQSAQLMSLVEPTVWEIPGRARETAGQVARIDEPSFGVRFFLADPLSSHLERQIHVQADLIQICIYRKFQSCDRCSDTSILGQLVAVRGIRAFKAFKAFSKSCNLEC